MCTQAWLVDPSTDISESPIWNLPIGHHCDRYYTLLKVEINIQLSQQVSIIQKHNQ